MTGIGIALGLFALILVGPGPLWVGRWRFLYQVPRAAVVLWQAGTIAALVSVTASGLIIAQGFVGAPLPSPLVIALEGVLLVFTAIVIGRLVWSLVTVIGQTTARRARHRHMVDLLGQVDPDSPQRGLRILTAELPLAYCLPGIREDSRVVVSQGALNRLGPQELQAVLAHENAHVRARHDLVIDTFTALQRAFPIAVRSEIPLRQCQLLVEMLADDAARRRTGPLPLARALMILAASPVPQAALGTGHTGARERMARLTAEAIDTRGAATVVYLLSAALIAAPAALIAFTCFQ